MTTFLKTLLIILLVYFTFRFLIKFAGPYIMRFLAKKAAERLQKSFGQGPFQQSTSSSNTKSKSKSSTESIPKSKKVVGEYIDFEEIE